MRRPRRVKTASRWGPTLCPDGSKVLDFDGTFETGAWAVLASTAQPRTIASHPTKATRSVRHGPVVGMRTLLVDDEERVIFRVRQEADPWSGVAWRRRHRLRVGGSPHRSPSILTSVGLG